MSIYELSSTVPYKTFTCVNLNLFNLGPLLEQWTRIAYNYETI